jgi:hypothetical protein
MERKAHHGQRRRKHLDKFDALRHPRFVEAVGKFTTEAGEEEVGPMKVAAES